MTNYPYPKQRQAIYFCREKSYGTPYYPGSETTSIYQWATNSTLGDSPLPAEYPHWRRLDVLPDTTDIVVPIIEKFKKFDIGDGKHPSVIESGNIKPVEFTLNMDAMGLEFLPLAIGKPSNGTNGQKVVQTITCIAETAGVDEEDYFFLDAVDDDNTIKHFLVWFNNGTGSAPDIVGIPAANRVEIDVSGGDKSANDIATLLETALEGLDEITSCTVSGADCQITTVKNEGAVQQARNGADSPGFSYSVSTWGSSTYSVTEETDEDLPSFTFHFEQANPTSAEDIVWDAYGCVVDSIELNITGDDGVATYSVTFKCPYAVENTTYGKATNPPPRKKIGAFPAMSSVQESAQNRILMEDPDTTTDLDRTPRQVNGIKFTINNNVNFHWDLSTRHANYAAAGQREVSMNVIGVTDEKELFTYYQGLYDQDGNNDWKPTTANGRLKGVLKLQRDATYDYIKISVYNWMIEEHDFVFSSVDDAVKAVDMTFTDGSSDSNGYIIDDLDFVSYIDASVMVV